jgi:hypothetical protein
MQRLLLGFAPAFVVLILFAACGGGSSTTTTTSPAGTTATASTTAAATAAATAAGTATGGGASATPADTGAPATLPDLPPGTNAVSDYHVFPNPGGPSILYTANITTPVSSDATAYWYSYQNGQWVKLQQAYITGLREQQVQGSFDSTPPDLIVLVVTS